MNIDPKYFLMFAGYPRSGHTLVASILNAHSNVMISNQLFILKDIERNIKGALYKDIQNGSNSIGTWKKEALVPHPPIPKTNITVIGDKTGHRTIELLKTNPENLEVLKNMVGIPVKWIHVVRNPYDNIATWIDLNMKNKNTSLAEEFKIVLQKYKTLNETINDLKTKEDILTLNHEKVIRSVDKTLDSL